MITRIVIQGCRKFRSFSITPDPAMNIIVGDNETGKSTLLEAITLALSGRIDGRWANEELNPYWFNAEDVRDYLAVYTKDPQTPAPSIRIELYFDSEDPDVQRMRGSITRSDSTVLAPSWKLFATPTSMRNSRHTWQIQIAPM